MGLDHGLSIKKRGRGNNKVSDLVTFRKCNQIHGWFLRNCVKYKYEDIDSWDGSYIEVTENDLYLLKKTIKTVLGNSKLVPCFVQNGSRIRRIFGKTIEDPVYVWGKTIINKRTAKRLLPTTDGFYFGSLSYDEYYIEQLEYAYKELERILKEVDFKNYTVLYWGWW